jgi:hypothetical protein
MAASVASTRKMSSTLIPCSSLLPALLTSSALISSSWMGGSGRGLRRLSDITVEDDGYKGKGGRHRRSWSRPEPFTLTFLSCWFFSGHPAWIKISTTVALLTKMPRVPISATSLAQPRLTRKSLPATPRTCKLPYLLASNPLP